MELIKKKSSIHRWGVFTKKRIPKDKYIIEYKGQIISLLEAEIRERIYSQTGISYLFQVSPNRIIDGGKDGNLAKYINHSCDPNCEVVTKNHKLLIYSKKTIKKDEELTIDYNFSKNSLEEPCSCGSEKCCGVINTQ